MNLSKVHHIAIICSDYRRSLDFYTKTLGLRVIAEHYRAARDSYKTDLALGDDYVVELFSFPLRHLAFATSDIDSAASELDRAGVPHEPLRVDEFTGKRFFFLRDPDDLPVEIYEA